MPVTVITKSRVGFSTAIIAILAIGGSEVLSRMKVSVRNEAIVCGTLVLLGLISWIKGRFGEVVQAAPRSKRQSHLEGVQLIAEDDPAVHPLAFLVQGKYWGMILVVSAGMLHLMCAWVHWKRAVPTSPPPPKPPVVVVKQATVNFPPLELQGVVHNGNKSTAVINGTTLCRGDVIGDVRLLAIGREEVTVELAGQTKVLALQR